MAGLGHGDHEHADRECGHWHGHHHHHHDGHGHGDAVALLDGLSPREVAFARGLRPTHDDVKLASLVTAGATLLFVQERLLLDEPRARFEEAEHAYAPAADRVRALRVRLGDERPSRYLAAIDEARRALGELRAATGREDWRDDRGPIGEATQRLAAANDQMREIGETFWMPEYVPSGSEGGPHSHGGEATAGRG